LKGSVRCLFQDILDFAKGPDNPTEVPADVTPIVRFVYKPEILALTVFKINGVRLKHLGAYLIL